VIFEKREDEVEVLVSVIAGRLEGVSVKTLCRFECEVEVLEVVDEVRVESGEERPSARRRRFLRGIVVVFLDSSCKWGYVMCEGVVLYKMAMAEFLSLVGGQSRRGRLLA